jgi:hypothetical protein
MDAPQPNQNPADPPQNPADAPSADPADLGPAGLKALQAERAARKLAETALAALQEEVRSSEAATLRAEVAAAHRLPPALARRLVGADRAALELDAAEMAAAITPAPVLKAPPVEKLQSGAIPASRPEPSASAVVDQVLNR